MRFIGINNNNQHGKCAFSSMPTKSEQAASTMIFASIHINVRWFSLNRMTYKWSKYQHLRNLGMCWFFYYVANWSHIKLSFLLTKPWWWKIRQSFLCFLLRMKMLIEQNNRKLNIIPKIKPFVTVSSQPENFPFAINIYVIPRQNYGKFS